MTLTVLNIACQAHLLKRLRFLDCKKHRTAAKSIVQQPMSHTKGLTSTADTSYIWARTLKAFELPASLTLSLNEPHWC